MIIAEVTVETFIDDLTNGASEAITWANTIGIAIMASIMAIALIKFLYERG